VDDGALLLVAVQDRRVRIEVGYGLEGALPDATANRIIDEVIVPAFRGGDYYAGISTGVDRMLRVIEGEPLPEPERRSPAEGVPACSSCCRSCSCSRCSAARSSGGCSAGSEARSPPAVPWASSRGCWSASSAWRSGGHRRVHLRTARRHRWWRRRAGSRRVVQPPTRQRLGHPGGFGGGFGGGRGGFGGGWSGGGGGFGGGGASGSW